MEVNTRLDCESEVSCESKLKRSHEECLRILEINRGLIQHLIDRVARRSQNQPKQSQMYEGLRTNGHPGQIHCTFHRSLVKSELPADLGQIGKMQIRRSIHQTHIQSLRKVRANVSRASEEDGKVTCEVCKNVFANRTGLKIHISKAHHIQIADKLKFVMPCIYCGKILSKSYSQNHVLQIHYLEHFKSQLPRNTTEENIKAAIKITHEANLTGDSRSFHCKLCSKICSGVSRKIHVLKMHFDSVLSILKSLA